MEFTFANGQTQVLANLIGPSESKFASKQDFSRAFVEVNLKTPQSEGIDNKALACDLRQCLE